MDTWKPWKPSKTSLLLGVALTAAGCATVTPAAELTTARASYARASSGPAAQLLPAELHKAKIVLDAAETSFAEEKNSPKTIDLAYIADRTIQTVEVQARTVLSTQTIAMANQDYQDKQAVAAKKTQATLVKTRAQLTDAQAGQAKQAEQLGVEHAARQEADSKAAASEQRALDSEQKTIAANQETAAANDALAKLAANSRATPTPRVRSPETSICHSDARSRCAATSSREGSRRIGWWRRGWDPIALLPITAAPRGGLTIAGWRS